MPASASPSSFPSPLTATRPAKASAAKPQADAPRFSDLAAEPASETPVVPRDAPDAPQRASRANASPPPRRSDMARTDRHPAEPEARDRQHEAPSSPQEADASAAGDQTDCVARTSAEATEPDETSEQTSDTSSVTDGVTAALALLVPQTVPAAVPPPAASAADAPPGDPASAPGPGATASQAAAAPLAALGPSAQQTKPWAPGMAGAKAKVDPDLTRTASADPTPAGGSMSLDEAVPASVPERPAKPLEAGTAAPTGEGRSRGDMPVEAASAAASAAPAQEAAPEATQNLKAEPAKADQATEADPAAAGARKSGKPPALPAETPGAPGQSITITEWRPAASTLQAADAQTPVAPGTPGQTGVPRTADAVPVNAVALEIGLRALSGSQSFQIRLHPEDLGRVDVKLDIDADGGVKALVSADRPETLALLQRDQRSLERAFEQAGLKTSDSGVQYSLADGSGRGDERNASRERQPQGSHAGQGGAGQEPPGQQIAALARSMRVPTGALDIVI